MQVLAKRSDGAYLVAADGVSLTEGMGKIAVPAEVSPASSELPIQSVLARGYWDDAPARPDEPTMRRLTELTGYA